MTRDDLMPEVDLLVNGHWVTVSASYLDDPEGLMQALEDEMAQEELDQEGLFW